MSGRSKPAIQIGEWVADPQTDTLSRGGETQKIEPRTMRMLLLLAEDPGDVVSVDRMLSEVWHGVVVSPASVYQAISQLRRTLGDSDSSPAYLATVPRKGYRLIAAVRPVTPAAPAQLTAAPSAPTQSMPPGAVPPPGAPARPRFRFPWLVLGLASLLLIAVVFIALHDVLRPTVDTADSVVVLPFVDMTDEQRDQVFCDGLTEELSNWLAQIPALRVVARTSAFAFRGQQDAREIGRTLNATHVLEGSIRGSGAHRRVTAQLIDARSGYQVWSSDFDQQVDDPIKTQELIARAVAASLQIRLTSSTTQRFAQRHSNNPQAYNLYLIASHYRLERTRESTVRAIELYQQALVIDPNFALAYVGLAYAYLNQHWVDTRSVSDVTRVAEPLLATALRLDPQLPELYAVRGALRSEQLRLDEAQSDLRRAVAMDPNNSWGFAELGRLYTMEGRPRDALDAYQHTLALDPLDFLHHARKCVALMDMSRYVEAEAACMRARNLQDQGNFGTVATAWLERSKGNIPEALRWNAEALASAPDDMDLYRQRAALLMAIGLSELARETYQRALTATHNEEEVNLGMAAVVFHDGGATALRAHLATTGLDASPHAHNLIRIAYYHLLAGDDTAAQRAIARARSASDFNAAALNDPWYARWGESDLLIVALCEQRTGDQDAANRHLHEILALLDREVAAGMNRFGTYVLRAKVLALLGDGDGAMQALTRAANLGWRREWWAQRVPPFATLRARNDFRSLMARVAASNETLIANAHAQLAH